MLLSRSVVVTVALAIVCGSVIGCNSKTEEFKSFDELGADAHDDHDHDHDHSHGHEHGPNGGEVFEIGDHDYHGEIVIEDASHQLMLFVLDHDLENPVQAQAAGVTLTMAAAEGAEPQVITLQPVVDVDGDAATASTFSVADGGLIHQLLDAGKLEGTLSLTIGEQAYSIPLDLPLHGEPHDHGAAEAEGTTEEAAATE